MCEWLSCREWCDVQLLCGGRTFSAHRAVLASVSTFLRQILLSCPAEESPTFIVLPDFDLEAMSSVLYYVYNGEVIIKKQKLERFLEIIKAMQIFIESQYLPILYSGIESTDLNLSKHRESMLARDYKVFSLEAESCEVQHYINIRKGVQVQDILSRSTLNDSGFSNKHVLYQDCSEQQKPSLGNLSSPCEDRQRNSFLRDLFIETYPQNGNANGQAAGVPAIPNEHYHGPTSVLLTNANGKHPRVDDVLSKTSETKHTSQLPNTLHPWKQLHNNETYGEARLNSSEQHLQSLFGNCNRNILRLGWNKDPWMNFFPRQQMPSYLDLSTLELNSSKTFQSINSNNSLETPQNPLFTNFNMNTYLEQCNKNENNNVTTTSTLARNAILNEVLESPWCPRVPNNYKPFRRKVHKTHTPSINTKAKETEIDNDSNNNIQISTLLPTAIGRISPNDTQDKSDTQSRIVAVSDYNCTTCDQVFTSEDSLASHMRRHSSTARYTCAECSKTFSQLRNFKYHMSVHRGTREFAATCPVCGKYFNDRGYLSSHLKIHRNRKEYKCSLCPKSFNQRVAYNMHVRIHTGVKPHVCSECGKAFSRKMLLKQHQRTHSGERPYACSHCDKRFADRSNMTLHLRLHTGVKPFSCSLCPKTFTKKHHLKSHLNFHTGAKPYSCPRCRLAFTQSSNMRTHYKKCTAPELTNNSGDKSL